MNADPIGDLAAKLTRNASPAPRTYQPVRRHSRHAGEREQRLWKQHNMFPRSDNNARMTVAEKYERATKRPGKRNGALGDIGLAVYRFLLRLRGHVDGRLDPSYKWIAEQIGKARSAVGDALARLKDAGFLDWVRRTQPVDDPERPNQVVEQIPNAFILTLPGQAAKIVRRIKRRKTDIERNAAMKRELEIRLAGHTLEQTVDEVKDPEMRAILHRLRIGVESANPPDGLK